jgi:hypothetical protein
MRSDLNIDSLFSFLSPTRSGLREPKTGPRALLVEADLRAINRQRQLLINNFGFEDTISDSKERVIPPAPGSDIGKGKGNKRKTLVGGDPNA